MEGTSETYNKGQGASDAGIRYQIKLLTWFLLRGAARKRQFKLATEMSQEDAGKFDDGIYSYINNNSETETILVQAKHKLSVSKKISLKMLQSVTDNEFSVCKYFHSYVDAIKNNDNFGTLRGLVLFTNSDVDDGPKNNYLVEVSEMDKDLQIIRIGQSGYYRLSSEFLNKLKNIFILYHCPTFAKYVLDLVSGKDVKRLYTNNVFMEIESIILHSLFELTSYRIDNVKLDVGNTPLYTEFKKVIEEELKRRSKTEIQQFSNLEDVNNHLKNKNIFVDKNIVSARENNMLNDLIQQFGKLFILAVNQPDVEDMDEFIRDLLKENEIFKDLSLNLAIKYLDCHVRKWFNQIKEEYSNAKKTTKGEYLNLTKTVCILNNVVLELLSQLSINNDISFNENYLSEFRNTLSTIREKSHIIILQCEFGSNLLVKLLHDTLVRKEDYLYVDIKWLKDRNIKISDVIEVLENNDSLLGLICYGNYVEIFQKLQCISQQGLQLNKVFYIVLNYSGCKNDIPNDVQFEHIHKNITFIDLSMNFQNYLLKNANVEFQRNEKCSLEDIVHNMNNFHDCINSEILNELMTLDNFEIGEKHQSVYDLHSAYNTYHLQISIDRFICVLRQNPNSEENELFHAKRKYLFAVSGKGHANETKQQFIQLLSNYQGVCAENLLNHDNIIFFQDSDSNPFLKKKEFLKICESNKNFLIFYISMRDEKTLYLEEVYNPFFYITRRLKVVESVELDVFKMKLELNCNKWVTFIIKGVTKHALLAVLDCSKLELELWIREMNVIIDNEGLENLDNVKNIYNEMHLIEYKDNKLMWIESRGSIEFIKNNKVNTQIVTEEEFTSKMENRLILISGDAGMGKSTLLTSLVQYIITDFSKWIIRINFKESDIQCNLKTLSDMKSSLELNQLLEFFYCIKHLNLESCFAKALFKFYLENNNHKTIFIFDGFDELPSCIQSTAKEVISEITKKYKCIVYLSTRQHYTPDIENQFSVFATRIEKISIESQSNNLVNYWKHGTILTTETKYDLHGIAASYINDMSNVLKDSIMFIGIPLHLRLLAETSFPYIFDGKFQEYLSNINDLKSLFDNFIEKKYEIYFREKKSNSPDDAFIQILRKQFDAIHAKFALQSLFPDYADKANIIPNVEAAEYTNDLLLIGILQADSMIKGFEFFHRLFSEYYCALFLVNCLKKEPEYIKYHSTAIDIVKNDFFLVPSKDPFKMLKTFVDFFLFVDLKLQKSIFHKHSISLDILKDLNTHQTDHLGRTALHIAAQYGDENTIRILLNQGFDSLSTDVNGRIPLHYAVRYELFENMVSLIEPYIDIDITNRRLFKLYREPKIKPDSIFELCKYEKSLLIKILNKIDLCGHSALHYTFENERWKYCSWLINHGAKCSTLSYESEIRLFKEIDTLVNNNDLEPLPTLALLYYRNIEEAFEICNNYRYQILVDNGYMICYKILLKKIIEHYSIDRLIRMFYTSPFLCDLENKNILHIVLNDISNRPTKYSEDYLEQASRYGHLECFKFVIDRIKCKFRIYGKGFKQSYEIYDEVENFNKCVGLIMMYNHKHLLDCIIWDNCQSFIVNSDGNTLLMVASSKGDLQMVRYINDIMIEYGIDVNYSNRNGKTALHFAGEGRKLDVIKYLVGKGGDVNCSDSRNKTVLDYVLTSNKHIYYDEEFLCIEYLVLECDARTINDDNITRDTRMQIVSATHLNVNTYVDGTTLLHKALVLENEALVNNLLILGANPNAEDSYGKTPLHYIRVPSLLSRMLLQYGAKFSLNTEHHIPPELYGAIEFGFFNNYINNSVMYITNARNYNGQTIIHKAALLNDTVAINETIKNDKYYSKQKYIKKYVFYYKQLDLSVSNYKGYTPLHYAAQMGHTDVAKLLLKNGAKYNTLNDDGKTPKQCCKIQENNDIALALSTVQKLFQCIEQNTLQEFEELLSNDNYINVQDDTGRTPLHCAIFYGCLDMVKLLLKNGANIEVLDDKQQTPLHYAALNGNLQMICYLLKNGATLDVIDKSGLQPKDIYEQKRTDDNILDIIDKIFRCAKKNEVDWTLFDIIKKHKDFATAAVNTCDHTGYMLLHYALIKKNKPLVYFILQSGGVYNKYFVHSVANSKGLSVYHNYDTYIMRLLLFIGNLFSNKFIYNNNISFNDLSDEEMQCVVNVRNQEGDKLLHCVKNLYVLKWLIKHSQDLDDFDKEGRTPLMRAVLRNDLFAAKVLYANGASLKMQELNSDSTIQLAQANIFIQRYLHKNGVTEFGHSKIVEIIDYEEKNNDNIENVSIDQDVNDIYGDITIKNGYNNDDKTCDINVNNKEDIEDIEVNDSEYINSKGGEVEDDINVNDGLINNIIGAIDDCDENVNKEKENLQIVEPKLELADICNKISSQNDEILINLRYLISRCESLDERMKALENRLSIMECGKSGR